jgi:hypothetical protein
MPAAEENDRGPALQADADGSREALAAAIVDLLPEVGAAKLEVGVLCARARVPEEVFRRNFASLEDCWLWTFEFHARRFDRRVLGAFNSEDSWRAGLRAAGYEAARFMDEEPAILRFGVGAMLAAGERAQLLREAQQQRMVDLLDAGRWGVDGVGEGSRAKAEASFGAIYQTVVGELTRGGPRRSAVDYVPELMFVAVRPFLGREAALEELRTPMPAYAQA